MDLNSRSTPDRQWFRGFAREGPERHCVVPRLPVAAIILLAEGHAALSLVEAGAGRIQIQFLLIDDPGVGQCGPDVLVLRCAHLKGVELDGHAVNAPVKEVESCAAHKSRPIASTVAFRSSTIRLRPRIWMPWSKFR